MKYNKRIVFDLDDTISHCKDRDWKNASCDKEIVDRINKLYDEGWEIVILTARGQISCGGDSRAADHKYRCQIETWLARNGVKYHELSFNKILAAFYVDDKAITPEDFKKYKLDQMVGGLSGAIIYRMGDRVYKTDTRSYDVANWYKQAKEYSGYVCPNVHSVIGKVICMDYIDGTMLKDYPIPPHILTALNLTKRCSTSTTPNDGFFTNYINRLITHLSLNDQTKPLINAVTAAYQSVAAQADANRSFCHGDYSMDNIIVNRNNDMFVIDPIPMAGIYSSWLLDATKLIQSVERYLDVGNLVEIFKGKLVNNSTSEKLIDLLVLSHWIRILKYAKYNDNNLYEKALNKITTYNYYQ